MSTSYNFNFPSNDNVKKTNSIKKTTTKSNILLGIDNTTIHIDENTGTLSFHGVLSSPRMSLNGWLYLPEELASQTEKEIPLTINHEEAKTSNPKICGTLKLKFNEDTWDLEYSAIANNKDAINGIKSKKYQHVSMTAEWDDADRLRGHYIPRNITTTHGSLVETPAVTTATVVTDSAYEICENGNCKLMKPIVIIPKNDSILNSSHIEIGKVTSMDRKTQTTKNDHFTGSATDEIQEITQIRESLNSEIENGNSTKEKQLSDLIEITGKTVEELESIICGQSDPSDETLESLKEYCNITSSDDDDDDEEKEEEEVKKSDDDDDDEEKEKKSKTDSKSTQVKKVKIRTDSTSTPQEITVKVDATDLNKAIKRIGTAITSQDKALGKIDSTTATNIIPTIAQKRKKFYDEINLQLRKTGKIDFDAVSKKMDAIGMTELGTTAGAQWLEDLTVVPRGLEASLRFTAQVVQIEKGAKEVHFTLMSTPTPVDGTAPNVPADLTHEITDIVATPVERVLKQRLTDQARRTTNVNLGNGIAITFKNSEVLDEDSKILEALDNIENKKYAGRLFPGTKTTEATVADADIFENGLLRKAKSLLLRQGWEEARIPGKLVCVMSPEQMEQLMSDEKIQRFIEWVSEGSALKTGAIPRLHGIDLLTSTQVPEGGGSNNTKTHRAFVYLKETAVGLGFTKTLEIETARYPEERATTLVGSYELAAKIKTEKGVVQIITHGSSS